MLKKTVKYEDFNGNQASDDFYFNLTKAELVELEMSYEEGFSATLQRIIDAKDNRTLIKEFKKLVLISYGVKSEDGKRFIKSDKLREEFEQTAAYSALFIELSMDSNAAAEFINGITPSDLMAAVQDKPLGLPPSPSTMATPPPPPPPSAA